MKRPREIELEEEVNNLIAIANERDEKGRQVQSVMQEETNPMILTLFAAPDALLEILEQRPVAFLQLLQTSKSLDAFLRQYSPNLWIRLLNRLVEMEMGTYASEIYPFFMIQHRLVYGEKTASKLPMGGPAFVTHDLELGRARREKDVKYYIIKYDDLTKEFIEVLRHFVVRDNRDGENMTYLENMLSKFLFGVPLHGSSPPYVACLADYFIVEDKDIKLFNYERWHERTASLLKPLYFNHTTEVRRYKASRLADRIYSAMVKNPDRVIPEVEPLSRETVQPYYTKLFGVEDGIYNTPEKQRDFFFTVLRQTGETPEEVIQKYGSSFFSCAICQAETSQVDPEKCVALCSTDCQSQYTEVGEETL